MTSKMRNNNTPNKRNSKNNKTIKKRSLGGLFEDNDLVNISYNGKMITCNVCAKTVFQKRNASIMKSKLQQSMFAFVTDSNNADALNDISITIYFCNECGNAITVRDPKIKSDKNYINLIRDQKIAGPV